MAKVKSLTSFQMSNSAANDDSSLNHKEQENGTILSLLTSHNQSWCSFSDFYAFDSMKLYTTSFSTPLAES